MREAFIAAARFLGFGWYVGLCIAGGFFLGRWIGQKLEAEAFFSLLGMGVGMLLAAYGIYATYSLLNRDKLDKDKQERR